MYKIVRHINRCVYMFHQIEGGVHVSIKIIRGSNKSRLMCIIGLYRSKMGKSFGGLFFSHVPRNGNNRKADCLARNA